MMSSSEGDFYDQNSSEEGDSNYYNYNHDETLAEPVKKSFPLPRYPNIAIVRGFVQLLLFLPILIH